jgi:hypothetical protein
MTALVSTGGAPTRPLPLANLIDTDFYDGTTANVTTQDVIGLAEYASANFFSNDTIFRAEFPHPSKGGLDTALMDGGYLGKKSEGVRVDHLVVAEGTLGKYRYSLDSRCYEEYADRLIPKAIRYAAAIPYYFFRGTLEVDAAEYADSSGVTQVGVDVSNLSPDDLGTGFFTLNYDDKDGTRNEIGSPIAVSGLTKNDPPLTLNFTPPESRAQDTYTLVFQGALGLEEGAVIAKTFTPAAYTFMNIDSPYDYHTYLYRITNTGRILGSGFTYDRATRTFAPLVFDQAVSVFAMNDQGDLAGCLTTWSAPPDTTVTDQGYLLTAGRMSIFDVPGMVSAVALDINTRGDAVGFCYTTPPHDPNTHIRAFLKPAGQAAVPFTVQGSDAFAYGINDVGQIVGLYWDPSGRDNGFLLTQGVFTTIAVPGTLYTEPWDINNHGEIVGTYYDTSNVSGFVLSNGRYDRIRYPGAAATWALGINDAGEITGYYEDAAGKRHGFVGVPRKKAP